MKTFESCYILFNVVLLDIEALIYTMARCWISVSDYLKQWWPRYSTQICGTWPTGVIKVCTFWASRNHIWMASECQTKLISVYLKSVSLANLTNSCLSLLCPPHLSSKHDGLILPIVILTLQSKEDLSFGNDDVFFFPLKVSVRTISVSCGSPAYVISIRLRMLLHFLYVSIQYLNMQGYSQSSTFMVPDVSSLYD